MARRMTPLTKTDVCKVEEDRFQVDFEEDGETRSEYLSRSKLVKLRDQINRVLESPVETKPTPWDKTNEYLFVKQGKAFTLTEVVVGLAVIAVCLAMTLGFVAGLHYVFSH